MSTLARSANWNPLPTGPAPPCSFNTPSGDASAPSRAQADMTRVVADPDAAAKRVATATDAEAATPAARSLSVTMRELEAFSMDPKHIVGARVTSWGVSEQQTAELQSSLGPTATRLTNVIE